MLKKRLISVFVGLALLVTVNVSSYVVADAFGLDWTPPIHAGACGGGEC